MSKNSGDERKISARLAEIDAVVEPMLKERKALRRQLAAIVGGKAGAAVRQDKQKILEANVAAVLRERANRLYCRNGGLVKATAREFGVSERTVGRIRARLLKSDASE